MCDPLTAAGAALSIGGTALNVKASNDAQARQQSMLDAKTRVSAEEFDKRQGILKTGDAEADAALRARAAERNKLDEDTFAANQTLSGEAADTKFTAQTRGYDDLSGVRGTRDTEQDAARAAYDAAVEEERLRQADFRGEADATVDTAVTAAGQPQFERNRTAANMMRDALLEQGGATVPGAMSAITTPVSAAARGAIERSVSKGVTSAQSTAAAGARVASFGDALVEGRENLTALSEDLRGLDIASRFSMAALPAELQQHASRYGNAATMARLRSGNIAQGVAEAVRLADVNRAGKADPLNERATSLDRAINDYYAGRLTTNNRFVSDTTGASRAFEGANSAITDYRIANLRRTSPIGTLMSTFGGTAMMPRSSGYQWSDLSNWLGAGGSPAGTPGIATGPGGLIAGGI